MGSGWPIFSENIVMLYQQDLQLGSYLCEMATGSISRVAKISH